jgi:uncharacterized protein (DUF58 family)
MSGAPAPDPAREVAVGDRALRQLELLVTRRLDGLLQGDHRGLVPGPGSEPGESRVYQPGDDVRKMDWNVLARTTVPHVRESIADRELETWAVVDQTASMNWGTARSEKRELAVTAVAAVGLLTARAGNRLGVLAVRPGGSAHLPPRASSRAVMAALRWLGQAGRDDEPAQGGLAEALEDLSRIARRRGLVVVVSDFLDATGWQRPLRALAHRHQLLAVEVGDPREQELPAVGVVAFTDPESGATVEVQTSDPGLRRRYAAAAAQQRAVVAAELRRCGADHLALRTDRDWVRDVVTFVAQQRRRRHAGQAQADPAAAELARR